jgi:ABC-type transporter Mla maintaining outer membrane lipid asymmetry ATPase subunit MlaF
MANFRYNPNSGAIERVPRGSEETVDTKFLIMQEGRLVFEGSEAEFLANPDSYVRKFAKPGAS